MVSAPFAWLLVSRLRPNPYFVAPAILQRKTALERGRFLKKAAQKLLLT